MRFINTNTEEILNTYDIYNLCKECKEGNNGNHGTAFINEFYGIIFDTLNGRNDFHIIGTTPDEVDRIINRIRNAILTKHKPTDPEQQARSAIPHTREFYPEETQWLETLTAYEWYPFLVTVTYDDALELLNAWKAEGIDDIPHAFLALMVINYSRTFGTNTLLETEETKMKEIIISGANWREKLESTIREAEGRATARTITPENIIDALLHIEKKLDVSRAALEGTTATVDYNAQIFPAAYKYTPESTIFAAVYRRGSWRVTDICRAATRRPGGAILVQMSESCKKAVMENHSRFGLY